MPWMQQCRQWPPSARVETSSARHGAVQTDRRCADERCAKHSSDLGNSLRDAVLALPARALVPWATGRLALVKRLCGPGCLIWQHHGLTRSQAARSTTAQLFGIGAPTGLVVDDPCRQSKTLVGGWKPANRPMRPPAMPCKERGVP